ncbi:MHS family MFS transporter [Leclercia adecarboxylata]|uniref:MHS family MFS transporter n=1 Tax=Leclercia adecarboxylata TaxID=83655 RepID=A0A9X3Y587_9ENTR|nr:MFS transporter [Leclercia adecarboxylata]MBD1403707.1 MHS family MFS transporter [Leclercia adecarboxylata]MDC6620671.1 MHS family MFS transporter [Leclercia adecarboxylata]MDC6631908.1 MHS family MFS transporter [Leclercia adecarboxylata]MDC6636797.1 MHS family MFS transporter [Leclercia adecarboxylata]MDC6647668.1 MHS family MFS transporter [Leclercia adecarboxylata]
MSNVVTETTAAPVAASQDAKQLRKLVIASVLGNALEWYDFFLYGTAAALVFGPLFFPVGGDPMQGTLLAFSGFAVGFLARPLGGIVFGHIGDRYSRKMTLIMTLTLMGATTFIIGLLPVYAQIGIWAPVSLITLRFLQGVASGGEWGGGVLMLSENAPSSHRGYFTAWSQMGVSGGFVLSAFAFYLVQKLPEEDLMSWGWRVPFLLSILIFLVGVYIRKNIRESKAFSQAKPETKHEKIPLMVLIREHPKALLQAIALRLPENGASYIFFTFSVVYAKHIGIGTGEIISAVTLAMLVEFFSILFWGALSDRIGLKPVYYIGVIGLLVMAFPFFWLLSTGDYGWIMLAMFLGLPFCHGAMIGTQPCIMSDLFPVRVRYSGLALGHEVGSIFSGGLGPMLAVALLMHFDASWPVSLLLMGYALLAWIALRSLPATTKNNEVSK